jgi:hypothetical protein
MTIIISNCTSQHFNLITQTIIKKSVDLNTTPIILSHNLDQQVTIEVSGGVAETTFASTGIQVEIIDHDNEENKS